MGPNRIHRRTLSRLARLDKALREVEQHAAARGRGGEVPCAGGAGLRQVAGRSRHRSRVPQLRRHRGRELAERRFSDHRDPRGRRTRWPPFAPDWCSSTCPRCRTSRSRLDGALYWTRCRNPASSSCRPSCSPWCRWPGLAPKRASAGSGSIACSKEWPPREDREAMATLGLSEQQFIAATPRGIEPHRARLAFDRAGGGGADGCRAPDVRRSRSHRRRGPKPEPLTTLLSCMDAARWCARPY